MQLQGTAPAPDTHGCAVWPPMQLHLHPCVSLFFFFFFFKTYFGPFRPEKKKFPSLVDSGVNIIHQMLLNLLMVMDLVLACTASFLCVLVLSLGDSSEYSECYPPNDVFWSYHLEIVVSILNVIHQMMLNPSNILRYFLKPKPKF